MYSIVKSSEESYKYRVMTGVENAFSMFCSSIVFEIYYNGKNRLQHISDSGNMQGDDVEL